MICAQVGWQLGKGSFGTVFVALSRANRRDVRAVKVIDLGHADARTISKLAVEVRTMRRVDHPNICRLDDCYLHEKKFSMVIEYCSGGELFDRITAKDHYSEREARVAFAQMVEAVGHCHRHEVAHRDLKPENVLYAGPEGTRSAHVLKVCDFGLSTTFGGGHHDLHRKVGTPGYVGPEVLTATEERGYGPECAPRAEINQCVRPAWRYYLLFWPPRLSARVLGVLARGILGLLTRTFDFRTGQRRFHECDPEQVGKGALADVGQLRHRLGAGTNRTADARAPQIQGRRGERRLLRLGHVPVPEDDAAAGRGGHGQGYKAIGARAAADDCLIY